MQNKETAVEWLVRILYSPVCVGFIQDKRQIPHHIIEKAKQMEKEQALGLMSDACMFFAASFHDHDLKVITYEDVYNKYYNGE